MPVRSQPTLSSHGAVGSMLFLYTSEAGKTEKFGDMSGSHPGLKSLAK